MPPHYGTPKRCRNKGGIEYSNAYNISYNMTEIYNFFGALKTLDHEVRYDLDRIRYHNADRSFETHDRSLKLTKAQAA